MRTASFMPLLLDLNCTAMGPSGLLPEVSTGARPFDSLCAVTDAPLSPERATALVVSVIALCTAVLAWVVALIALLRGRRAAPVIGDGVRLPEWIGAAHLVGLLALLPAPEAWGATAGGPPAFVVARALAGAIAAMAAAALFAWDTATRRRYMDRSPGVMARARFLTYGPYAHVRRPRELALLLLVCGTAFVLPGWWRPVLALGVFGASLAARARFLDDVIAREAGEEYARYCEVTALLFPRGRGRDRRAASTERDRSRPASPSQRGSGTGS
jgi:protein-S-isoprenylcysteine O-methyltransferase Ste14